VQQRWADYPYRQIVGSADALRSMEDGSFDVIFCHNVLEYALDREEILREFHRLLKPQGIISLVKHNRPGRVMQMVVLLNEFEKADALLNGEDGCASVYGTIHYYEDNDVTKWCEGLHIKETFGIRMIEEGFLHELQALCEAHNTVLICDEIQCGYGRSGKFFAHQHLGVRPDMITVAKGICNGFPMGGVLISPKFTPIYGQLGTTFGGNHLGCAGALAVLDVIESEGLVENAAKVGEYIMTELRKMQLPHVVDVRGRGLMIGIELDIPYKEPRTRLIKEEHIFTGCSGTNVIRLLPPLCLTIEEANVFLEAFRRVLS
jgi:hypothetical protein